MTGLPVTRASVDLCLKVALGREDSGRASHCAERSEALVTGTPPALRFELFNRVLLGN